MLSGYLKRNKLVIIFLFCVVFGISLYTNLSYFFKGQKQLALFPPFVEGLNLNYNKHLGAEYYFIAEAIASGKGFSNPFQVNTGPTAWMPPLYPFFLAFLIELFHSTLRIACVIIFLKNIVLIFTGLVIYEIAQRTLITIKAECALLLYLLWLLSNFRSFFQITHDTWLLLLFISVIFPLTVFIQRNHITLKTAIVWGVVGGLAMLLSPVVGFVWCVLWLSMLLVKKDVRMLTVSLVVFFLCFSPWVIRNYSVFGKLIFMKSNLYFDAYFVNYEIEKDGLIDGDTFSNNHPVWTVKKDEDSLYLKLGEVKFLERYKEKFLSEIKRNPYAYLQNIKNRLCAALFIYYPHNNYERFIMWKMIIHVLPFVCVLFIIFLKGCASSHYIKIAMVIYGLYLIPYIVVIYYIRYSIPLTPLKVLFMLWGIDLLIARWRMRFPCHPPVTR